MKTNQPFFSFDFSYGDAVNFQQKRVPGLLLSSFLSFDSFTRKKMEIAHTLGQSRAVAIVS